MKSTEEMETVIITTTAPPEDQPQITISVPASNKINKIIPGNGIAAGSSNRNFMTPPSPTPTIPAKSSSSFLGADLLSIPNSGGMPPPKLNVVKKSRVMVNPGKSMVEWMKIQQELTTKGPSTKLRKIGQDELATHNTEEDCWMALNDKVYDVSEYLKYHPGGVEELMKGAGIDGTTLFNQIHRWVNYESILKGNLLGYLVRHPTLALINKLKVQASLEADEGSNKQLMPKAKFSEDEDSLFLEVDSESSDSQECWTVGVLNRERLMLKVVLKPPDVWMAHLQLVKALQDDRIQITFQNKFKRALIKLKKPKKEKWKALGAPLEDNNKCLDSRGAVEDLYPARLIRKTQLTHNVFLFTLQLSHSAVIGVPVGFHLRIRINGISRKYTPASQTILDKYSDNQTNSAAGNNGGQEHHFIIKVYPDGELTPLINAISVNDSSIIELGCPGGSFNISFLDNTATLVILAAGSGITPFIRIIQYLLLEKKRSRSQVSKIILMFFNETSADMIWNEEWTSLALDKDATEWFYYFPVISKPSLSDTTNFTGRIRPELFEKCVTATARPEENGRETLAGSNKALICGTYGFNDACKQTLRTQSTLKFNESQDFFVFTG